MLGEVIEKRKRQVVNRVSRSGDEYTGRILAELKECSNRRNLERGKEIHAEVIRTGIISCVYVSTALINMYTKCRSIVDARQVFDCITRPDVVSWNALIFGYAKNGYGLTALDLFGRMKFQGCAPKSATFIAALKACTSLALEQGKSKAREWGKQIHSEIGCHSDIYVQSTLIDMYGKCGSMADARQVFDCIKHPDVVPWNALIMGYAENGEYLTSLDLYGRMKFQGCAPDSMTFLAALRACASLAHGKDESGRAECRERGKQIHLEIGSHSDIYVQTSLIDMYAKCGSMTDAYQVFCGIEHPNVVSWTALILGYAENVEGVTALDLFARMKLQGCAPNSMTYVAALKACISLAEDESGKAECKEHGMQIHSEIGCHLNIYVQNTLIDMYSKCGAMVDALQVFNGIKNPDVISWSALILGYAENGKGLAGLELFARMKSQGCVPNSITYMAALKSCTSLAAGTGKAECRERGKQIHSEIGCHLDINVQNTLIDMYSKCGNMVDAQQVFDSNKHPNVVSWNALISGYAENGQGVHALDLFGRMKSQGCAPDCITIVAALKACTSLTLEQDESGKAECKRRGKQIHSDIGCHSDFYVQGTLIDMYAKCKSMADARQVFDDIEHPDVVSWNALMMGYAENGECGLALDLFAKMSCAPNSKTYVAALKACGSLGDLESGRKIHAEVRAELDAKNERDTTILLTCLVDFYAKCGSMVEAQKVFDSHPNRRDFITWNALLGGYSRLGDSEAVFRVFEGMQDAGFQPDSVTFICILSCCSHSGLVEKANEIFKAMLTNYGITPTVDHYSCMVDILCRSNKLDEVVLLLRSMPCEPSAVTWLTVLDACRKWKNVEIGRQAFKSLENMNNMNATAYVLMAQVYGSKGMWDEQEGIVIGMTKEFQTELLEGRSTVVNA